jgi:hypothetical protein
MNQYSIKVRWHLALISSFGFIGTVLLFIATGIFSPMPDFTQDPPLIPQLMLTFGQAGTSLLILGCVAYAIKLVEDKRPLAAIGFSMLSIAQGVIFVLYLISYNGVEKFAEAYRMFSASLYLLIPSLIIIAIYSGFPLWLRLLGVVACIPYVIENVMFHYTEKFTLAIMIVDAIGNVLFNLVFLLWGIVVIRVTRKELKTANSEK